MVENSAYCTDILTQVSAIQSALNAFNRELLARHIRTCVVTDIQRVIWTWWTIWWPPFRK